MKQLEITAREAEILEDTLRSDLSDLRMEIADTEEKSFREELKDKEDVLRSLIDRLANAASA